MDFEHSSVAEWNADWDRAIAAEDVDRFGDLTDAGIFLDDWETVFHAALMRAFGSPSLVSKGVFSTTILHCDVAWSSSWNEQQRMALLELLFPQLPSLKKSFEIALLGDWVSEGAAVPIAKRWMIEMIRRCPQDLGDVLFSMKTRLFPRLTADDAVEVQRVYDHIHTIQEKPSAEWVAQQFEAIWPETQGGG